MTAELPELIVATRLAAEHGAADDHDQSDGVLLVLAKKGASRLTYRQALEEPPATAGSTGERAESLVYFGTKRVDVTT
jgi:hypothetical protein